MTEENNHQKTEDTANQKTTEKVNNTDITELLEDWFLKKAPRLPENVVNAIVQYLPIVVLIISILSAIGIVIGLPLLLGVNLLGALAGSNTGSTTFDILIAILGYAISAISVYFSFKSYPGLKAKTKSGWKYTYWNVWLSVIGGIIRLPFGIFSAIISAVIGFYIVFQIKSKYK